MHFHIFFWDDKDDKDGKDSKDDEKRAANETDIDEGSLEASVDAALARADYNFDGYISWEEYKYSITEHADLWSIIDSFIPHTTDNYKS